VTQDELQVDFLYRAIERFADWVKYEDAKAGAVLVVLAIGTADLAGHGHALAHAHTKSFTGVLASIVFWFAIIPAAVTIGAVGLTVMPSVTKGVGLFGAKTRPAAAESLYFFDDVAKKYKEKGADGFRDAVKALGNEQALIAQLAPQAWALAVVASTKVKLVQVATGAALVFIAAWAVARVLLHLH
jgi:hypothetical protein